MEREQVMFMISFTLKSSDFKSTHTLIYNNKEKKKRRYLLFTSGFYTEREMALMLSIIEYIMEIIAYLICFHRIGSSLFLLITSLKFSEISIIISFPAHNQIKYVKTLKSKNRCTLNATWHDSSHLVEEHSRFPRRC